MNYNFKKGDVIAIGDQEYTVVKWSSTLQEVKASSIYRTNGLVFRGTEYNKIPSWELVRRYKSLYKVRKLYK